MCDIAVLNLSVLVKNYRDIMLNENGMVFM